MTRATYRNDLSELAKLADFVAAFCDCNGVDSASKDALQLCLDEAATNIISYAWGDGGAHTFTLSLAREADGVSAELCDDGIPFNPLADAPAADTVSEIEDRPVGGLGIHFCKTLMHRLEYKREKGRNLLSFFRRCA